MRGTNIYLPFVGKRIKTWLLYFFYWLLYPDVLPVKVHREEQVPISMGCKWEANYAWAVFYQPQTLFHENKATYTPFLLQCDFRFSVQFRWAYPKQNFAGITKHLLSPNFFEEYYTLITILWVCERQYSEPTCITCWGFCNLYSFSKEDYPLSEQAMVNWFQEQILLALKTEMIRPLVIKVPRSSHQIWLITFANSFSMLIKLHSNIQNHLWSWHSKPVLMAPDERHSLIFNHINNR